MRTTERARKHDQTVADRAEGPPSARPTNRLCRLGICVPANLVNRAGDVAAARGMTRNAVLKLALERGIGSIDAGDLEPAAKGNVAGRKWPPDALEQLRFRIGTDEKGRIQAFAVRNRYRDLSAAIADLVTTALDAHDLGENVPATKAEEIDQRLVDLRDLLDRIGPGVFGILSLLAHWSTQSGGLEVDEDELIDEAWTAGEQAWETRREIAADDARENSILGEEGGP
jgi:hypothetical protein